MSQTEKTIQNYRTLREQQGWADAIRKYLSEKYETPPLAHVHSFGCQQSVYDGERFKGVLAQLGYGFTDEIRQADLILYNTCAVRENAEQRVFGNVGALKGLKKQKPDMVIALAGCMTEQQQVSEKLKMSYPYVDLVMGSNAAGGCRSFCTVSLSKGGAASAGMQGRTAPIPLCTRRCRCCMKAGSRPLCR